MRIDYERDHLGKVWPVNDNYEILVEARDVRIELPNSYYGISNTFTSARKKHEPPNLVDIEVTYNLTDGIGDGERGKMKVTYTHPEAGVDASVTIYAYQDNKYVADVYTGDFYNGESRIIECDFIKIPALKRSKRIIYFAVATDKLVGMTSLTPYFDKTDVPLEEKLKYIPYLIPDNDGKYGVCDINVDGILYSYNEGGHYIGPVQKGYHYYNEEPPATIVVPYDENLIPFKSAEIKWTHVKDPDNDDVSYEIYVAGNDTNEYMNNEIGKFFTDDLTDSTDLVFDDLAILLVILLKLHYQVLN